VPGAAERRAAVAGSFGPGPFDSWEHLNLMDRCQGTIGFPIVLSLALRPARRSRM